MQIWNNLSIVVCRIILELTFERLIVFLVYSINKELVETITKFNQEIRSKSQRNNEQTPTTLIIQNNRMDRQSSRGIMGYACGLHHLTKCWFAHVGRVYNVLLVPSIIEYNNYKIGLLYFFILKEMFLFIWIEFLLKKISYGGQGWIQLWRKGGVMLKWRHISRWVRGHVPWKCFEFGVSETTFLAFWGHFWAKYKGLKSHC